MKDLIIKVPKEFTEEQCDFLVKSCMNKIEAELRKELKPSKKDINACNARIEEFKTALKIQEERFE
jgi:hypothetical protein